MYPDIHTHGVMTYETCSSILTRTDNALVNVIGTDVPSPTSSTFTSETVERILHKGEIAARN